MPFDTYTSFVGTAAPAAEMPAWIVFFGEAMVPALPSLPVSVSTKMAFAMLPTMPSQLPSTFARVGRSLGSVDLHSQPLLAAGGTTLRSPFRSTYVALHIHEQAGAPPAAVQAVAALARSGQGLAPCTQYFFTASQANWPTHASMLRRSHTESPGVQVRVWMQLTFGSQYELAGQFVSSGLCVHAFVFTSQLSFVHAIPSSQFIGLFVGTQNPPRHASPLLPVHKLGDLQSSFFTQGCAGPLSPPPSVPGGPPSVGGGVVPVAVPVGTVPVSVLVAASPSPSTAGGSLPAQPQARRVKRRLAEPTGSKRRIVPPHSHQRASERRSPERMESIRENDRAFHLLPKS